MGLGHSTDFEDWFFSCWSSSWKSRCRCGWITYLLWLWYDGRDQNFYTWEAAWTFLCGLWKRCKKGILFSYYCFLDSFIALEWFVEWEAPIIMQIGCSLLFSSPQISIWCNIECLCIHVINMIWLFHFSTSVVTLFHSY